MRSEGIGRQMSLVAVWACVAALVLHAAAQSSTEDSSSTGDFFSSSVASSSTGPVSSTGFNISQINTVANQLMPRPFPNDTVTFCETTDQGAMRVYDNTTVCLVLGGVAKMLFYVNVDEYSLMQIVVPFGENTTGAFDNTTFWFSAEYSNARSPAKLYHPQAPGYETFAVPFYTLLITLKDGRVDKMEWDDGCLGCSGDACVMDQCSVDIYSVGCRDPGSRADCNPKFFIGWFGTDRNGQYLTSAGARYSRFRSYSLNSAFNEAYATASVNIPAASDYTFSTSCANDPNCEQN